MLASTDPCSGSLPVRCPSDRDDANHHRGGPGRTRTWLWSRHVGTPRLCTANPVVSIKGPRGTSIPFVLIPGEGGAEARMAAVGISQAVFQPGVSVKCSPRPRAEDESQVHVPLARQDARHDCHRVNGWHPALPASVPPAPTAARPVHRALLRSHRQTQVGERGGGWDVPGLGGTCLRVGGEEYSSTEVLAATYMGHVVCYRVWYALGFHGMVGIPLGRVGSGRMGAMLPPLMVCFSSTAGLRGASQVPGCPLSWWHGDMVPAQRCLRLRAPAGSLLP